MSALPIAAVALDKDGVTFDSERIYADALLLTLRALPKPYPEPEALAARCSGESSTATAAILQAALGDTVDMKVFLPIGLRGATPSLRRTVCPLCLVRMH